MDLLLSLPETHFIRVYVATAGLPPAVYDINPLKTKLVFYIRTQDVPRNKHSLLRL